MEMEALIDELSGLVEKIKSGSATLGELEAFVSAAGQLNERAIVLRYKAYEAHVYSTPVAVKEEVAPLIQAQEPEPEREEPIGEAVEDETPAFDLFSVEEEEIEEEEPAFELDMDEADKETVELLADEPVADQTVTEIIEIPEEKPEPETPTFSSSESKPNYSDVPLHGIYSKLTHGDNSLAARLMTVRLETLKGAFGFNERLQIIQELFHGSNDEFSKFIDEVEHIASKDEARQLVSSFATKYNWDKESSLALEFVQKVERKYA